MSGLKYNESGCISRASFWGQLKSRRCWSTSTQDLKESTLNSLHWWKKSHLNPTSLKQCPSKVYKKPYKDSVTCWLTFRKHWVIIYRLKEQHLPGFTSSVMMTCWKLLVTVKTSLSFKDTSPRCTQESLPWRIKKLTVMITSWRCPVEKEKLSTSKNQSASLKTLKLMSGWLKSIMKWGSHWLLIFSPSWEKSLLFKMTIPSPWMKNCWKLSKGIRHKSYS